MSKEKSSLSERELTLKIYKAQIFLDDLKKAIKLGQKNINILRRERYERQQELKGK